MRPLLRHSIFIVVSAALAAFAGCLAVGVLLGIRAPEVHDEFSYLLAADTFLQGRLANPMPQFWEHFESFHILVNPSYASKYPPAQGLALAAGTLVGGHPVVGVWLSNALMCGAIAYLLVAWLPRRWAALGAALAVVQFSIGGYWAQEYWGGAMAAAGGALVYGAARRLAEIPRLSDSLLLVTGMVILANSRPFEGALVAFPAALVVAYGGWSSRGEARRRWLCLVALPAGLLLATAAGGMAWYNYRVTGDPFQLPHALHAESYLFVPLFLFSEIGAVPDFLHPAMEKAARWEALMYERQSSPAALLGAITWKLGPQWHWYLHVPGTIALMGLVRTAWDRWTALAALAVAVTVAAHWLLSTYGGLPHYLAPAAGLVVFLQGRGLQGWSTLRLGGRTVGVGAAILVLVATLPQLIVRTLDSRPHESSWAQGRADFVESLRALPGQHLVIVRYGPRHIFHEEWVYNGAELEAEPVLFARAIDSDRDRRLIESFPDRQAWLLRVTAKGARWAPHPLANGNP